MNFLTPYSSKALLGHLFGMAQAPFPASLSVGLLDVGGIEVSEYAIPTTSYARVVTNPTEWAFITPSSEWHQIGVHNKNVIQFPAVGNGEIWRVKMIGLYITGTNTLLMTALLEEEIAYGAGSAPIIPIHGITYLSDFTKL